MSGKLFNVGKIVNTHGIKGELKVISQTDFPELRFSKGSELILLDPEGKQRLNVTVEGAREHKGLFYVRFKGWNDINQVEKYKGWSVKVDEAQLAELDEGEYYFHEIIGCRVVTREGQELGTVAEILTPGANHVWVVKRPKGKDILIPVIDEVIADVNVAAKLITIEPMEGLIDE